MNLKDFLVWTLIGVHGLALLFNCNVRNQFFEAFSYAFNRNTPKNQEIADLVRLVLSITMSFAFGGVLINAITMKFIALIALVAYTVLCQIPYFLGQFSVQLDVSKLTQLGINIFIVIVGMISLIDQLVKRFSPSESQKKIKHTQALNGSRRKNSQKIGDPLQNERKLLIKNKRNN